MGTEETLKELDEMSTLISGATMAPSTDSISTDAPGTDVPVTESVATDAPGTDAPTTEAPEIDDRDETIKSLRNKLELLEGGKKEEITTPVTDAPLTFDEVQFLSEDVDLDDLIRDTKEFNKILNKVYQQGINTARKTLGEGVLRSIPDIVKNNIAQFSALRKASEDFYEKNVDLQPFKKVVAATFEEIASANPDWSYEKAMEETGKEARNRLELHKKAIDNNKDKLPKLPNNKGNRRGRQNQPDTNPLLSELDAMNNVLNN